MPMPTSARCVLRDERSTTTLVRLQRGVKCRAARRHGPTDATARHSRGAGRRYNAFRQCPESRVSRICCSEVRQVGRPPRTLRSDRHGNDKAAIEQSSPASVTMQLGRLSQRL
jgi:hypothetical protein